MPGAAEGDRAFRRPLGRGRLKHLDSGQCGLGHKPGAARTHPQSPVGAVHIAGL